MIGSQIERTPVRLVGSGLTLSQSGLNVGADRSSQESS